MVQLAVWSEALHEEESEMNLKILPTNVMLAQSRRWLTEPELRDLIQKEALGAAMLLEVGKAHDRLSLQSERRRKLAIALARLTKLIGDCDVVYDSKGRAIYNGLTSLAEGTDDPELARLYLDLRDLLFPEGLVIVTRSYSYEAGAIEALERRVTSEVLAQLESIRMGTQTMAEWYRAWVAAGHELGRLVGQRASALARTTRGGTGVVDVDLRAARGHWISTVQTFLSSLVLMDLALEERENLLSALSAVVLQATRSREGDEESGSDDPDSDDPGSDDPGSDDPGDGELPPVEDIIVAPTPGDDLVIAPPASSLTASAAADREPSADA
ncbi:MAG TPA: hypothetical protein VNM90_19120 [Haliangium sp.]|nr:hypothetical protein [Haliangium sp.]